MILCKKLLPQLSGTLAVPADGLFDLPEKVLQFGTGVLLRGLPDYYIDKANRQGVFNGRIAVVKSTAGDADEFDHQDSLYTLHVKGVKAGKTVDEQMINSAISQVLLAGSQWGEILRIAHSSELKIVLSNTTEVGIQFVAESIGQTPPASFPGKLLAFLLERYNAFNGDLQSGLTIIPTELLINNGDLLKQVILQLAAHNNLDISFINWLMTANRFCNSLVDRIVPGKPAPQENDAFNWRLGYNDNLRIVAEPYSLWAIQGGPEVAEVLSFSKVSEEIVITPEIEKFRELKLRLLNGTHTLSCAIACLSGYKTVDEAMADEVFLKFVTRLMAAEITPAIPYNIDSKEADQFAATVIDRFSNPYVKHQWMSIAVQYSLKMRTRVVPLLLNYCKRYDELPPLMTLGFAAFIAFVQKMVEGNRNSANGNASQPPVDSNAGIFNDAWQNAADDADAVRAILTNTHLWDTDLAAIPGFEQEVMTMLGKIESAGMQDTLKDVYQKYD